MMEASLRCLPPGPVLCVVHGAFGARFAHTAAACGRERDVLDIEWGGTPELAQVEERLAASRAAGKPYVAVTLVHSETSTGVFIDAAAFTKLAHAYGARCLVDSVTGIAGAPFEMDAWGLDFAFTGSQKALALPPGLAFGAASEQFIADAGVAGRGAYFDLVEYERFAQNNQTPSTPALSLLYAAQVQLAAIEREGIEARCARHAAMAALTHDRVAGWSSRTDGAVRVLAPAGFRSPTVSVVTTPPGIKAGDVVTAVADRGFVIGGGYGKLRGTSIRVGHMGDHTVDGLARCLDAVEAAITDTTRGTAR
jgi:aspartate aminotransferase-like enzyme